MRNEKQIVKQWLLWAALITLVAIFSCKKEYSILPEFEAVTFIFKETKDTIIHWHRVGGEDLARFRSYPRESVIAPGCDERTQVLIIGKDLCKN